MNDGKIRALTQLLHCHTELSQAVDLIQRNAFMCHQAEEERSEKAPVYEHILREEAFYMMGGSFLTLPCTVQMYGTP